jgi:uncharacterized membrane protein
VSEKPNNPHRPADAYRANEVPRVAEGHGAEQSRGAAEAHGSAGAHGAAEAVARARGLQRLIDKLDPVWAPQLVVVFAIALDLVLPDKLTIGPFWLLPAVEGVLLLGLAVASPHPRVRHSPLRRQIAMGLIGLVSAVNVYSLVELVRFLLNGHRAGGRALIFSGVALWITNVLLFGLWYWELDRGGPVERAKRSNKRPDFLFPQMTTPRFAPSEWMPGLVDYLYVSFTNATAFSPTDTMPLSQAAKVLMSAQAVVSLLIVVLVVARAVNILALHGA